MRDCRDTERCTYIPNCFGVSPVHETASRGGKEGGDRRRPPSLWPAPTLLLNCLLPTPSLFRSLFLVFLDHRNRLRLGHLLRGREVAPGGDGA